MSQCKYTQWFIDKRVLVSGKESILHTQNPLEIGLLPKGGIYNDVLVKCSDRDFHTRWDTITNVLSAAGFGKVANTIFVMENGDDATGLIEDFNKPFRNIYTAVAAASAGDTVIVYPGTYTHANGEQLIKYGINIYLMEGVEVIINNYKTITASGFDTIELGGESNIYGNGNITINFPPSLIVRRSDVIKNVLGVDNNITISLNKLKVNGVTIVFDNINTLNINIKNLELYSNLVGVWIEKSSSAKITVDINSYISTSSLGSIGANIQDLINSTVTVNINNVNFTSINSKNGFISTSNNDTDSTINVNVYNIIYINATTQTTAKAPLVSGSICYAYKNINFYNFKTSGRLYLPSIYNSTGLEKGQMTFNGTIIEKSLIGPSPVIVDNIIICEKFLQAISFNLNVYDESLFSLASLPAQKTGIINVSSPDRLQKIKGYFSTIKEPSLNNPVCMVSSTSINNATLDNFTCVSNGLTSIQNVSIPVLTADIPIKDVYTNAATDPTNLSLLLDTLFFDATYVV